VTEHRKAEGTLGPSSMPAVNTRGASHLVCRNYHEYKGKACWSQIGTFQKSVLELFSKMVTLRVEDGVKRKTQKFCEERSGHKI
jgi:hypothetical protein